MIQSERDSLPAGTENQVDRKMEPSLFQLSTRRKLLFAGVACLLFFGFLELMLLLVGVTPLASEADPSAGFDNRYRLFELDNAEKFNPVYKTAQNRHAYFNEQSFPQIKSEKAFRVFSLGGSTTYGRPYDDRTSFSGFLRENLKELEPSRDWEVINAGGISYATPRIAILAEELIEYRPDLFILYTGHNEFLEDRTYASLKKTPEPVQKLNGIAAHLRSYTVLHRILHGKQNPQSAEGQSFDEVRARLDDAVGPVSYHRDEKWRADVTSQFRANLKRIIETVKGANARLILVTPAVNLRSCSPFKSENRDGITPDELRTFREHVSQARKTFEGNDLQAALTAIEKAVQIDDRHAETLYLHGEILYAMERFDDADAAFRSALEEDVCPLRALAEITKIVREVAKEHELPLIDFAAEITDRAEHRIPGEDWFLDHVHPTIDGHQLLGRMLAEAMIEQELVSPSESWTEESWDDVAQTIRDNIDPRQRAMALRNLAKVFSWAGKNDDADKLASQAVEQLGDDAEALTMAGNAALREGKVIEAREYFLQALDLDPENVRSLSGLGDALTEEGDLDSARLRFEEVTRLAPGHASGWFNLGNVQRDLGQTGKAIASYRKAITLKESLPDVHNNLALLLMATGNIDAGVKHFGLALQLEPDCAERHAALGLACIDAGNSGEASKQFQQALTIDPQCVSALIGTALLYQDQGNNAAAVQTLRRAQQADPENPHVKNLLRSLSM